jgi:hypothetical protein
MHVLGFFLAVIQEEVLSGQAMLPGRNVRAGIGGKLENRVFAVKPFDVGVPLIERSQGDEQWIE